MTVSLVCRLGQILGNPKNHWKNFQPITPLCTLKEKIKYLHSNHVRKANASGVVKFSRNCRISYQSKLYENEVFFFAKDNRGHVAITYWYELGVKRSVEKEIQNALNLIKFSD